MQMVETKSALNDYQDCLLAPQMSFEIGVQVSNTGITNNSEGKKIIPAGTPIGGDTDAKTTRNAVLKVTNSSTLGEKAQGILRYPVDVTNGNATASMIIVGVIDESKCPTIDATVKTALPHIVFVNGGNE